MTKQPTWLKEIELLLISLIITGGTTFLTVEKLIDPTFAGVIFTGLASTVLLAFGHKLALPNVPVQSYENIAQQLVSLVTSQQQAQASSAQPSAPAQPEPAKPVAAPVQQPAQPSAPVINLHQGV